MPLTEKKKASNAKWDSVNLKRMSLAIPVELYDRMTDHIKGESVNGFIKRAIEEKISRDGYVDGLTLTDLTEIKVVLESLVLDGAKDRTERMIENLRDRVVQVWTNAVEQDRQSHLISDKSDER